MGTASVTAEQDDTAKGGTQVTELEPDLYQALRRRSFEEHRPMTEIVREALRKYLGV